MPSQAPCVSVMCAASKVPAPAQRTVRLGASCAASTSIAGTTASGRKASSISLGNRSSVMRVAAVGARQFTRMSFFAPSMLSVCIKPTSASLAAP